MKICGKRTPLCYNQFDCQMPGLPRELPNEFKKNPILTLCTDGSDKEVDRPVSNPSITATNPRDALVEAIDAVNKSGLIPKAKADLLEQYIQEIENKFVASHNWKLAAKMDGTDGSVIFLGKIGEAVVVSPNGAIFTGRLAPSSLGFYVAATGQITPIYHHLKRR